MPKTKENTPPPTFGQMLLKAVSNKEDRVVKFFYEEYKDHFIKEIKKDMEMEKYFDYYGFLQNDCGINLTSDFGIDFSLLNKFQGAVGRANFRREKNSYVNASELFDLLIGRYLESETGTSLVLISPFATSQDSRKEVLTFIPFANDKKQIKVTTNKLSFDGQYQGGDDWSEYETFCKALDTCDNKSFVAKAILESCQWFPQEKTILNDIEITKTKEFLDKIALKIRRDLSLDKLNLTNPQIRASSMMFGVAICENHRIPGALKHFRTCLRMVCDEKEDFSTAFNADMEITKCVLSPSGGTRELRRIYNTGAIPDGLDGSFAFSDSSDDEKVPTGNSSKTTATAVSKKSISLGVES